MTDEDLGSVQNSKICCILISFLSGFLIGFFSFLSGFLIGFSCRVFLSGFPDRQCQHHIIGLHLFGQPRRIPTQFFPPGQYLVHAASCFFSFSQQHEHLLQGRVAADTLSIGFIVKQKYVAKKYHCNFLMYHFRKALTTQNYS